MVQRSSCACVRVFAALHVCGYFSFSETCTKSSLSVSILMLSNKSYISFYCSFSELSNAVNEYFLFAFLKTLWRKTLTEKPQKTTFQSQFSTEKFVKVIFEIRKSGIYVLLHETCRLRIWNQNWQNRNSLVVTTDKLEQNFPFLQKSVESFFNALPRAQN